MTASDRLGGARQTGFTLVELVMVIVLLGVAGVGVSSFISSSVQAYIDVARRDNLSQQGRYAVERMTRELRNALPGSVRVSSGGAANPVQCLEFVPIVAASSYLDLPVSSAASSFEAVSFAFSPQAGTTYYAAVFTSSVSDVYSVAPNNARRAIDNVSPAAGGKRTISFASPSQFPHASPQRRLYIVAAPVSFCAQDNLLTRHAGYAYSAAQSLPPTNGITLARYIRVAEKGAAYDIFDFTPGALQRNGTVQMDLRFSVKAGESEWVKFSQAVFLRNAS